jgi:hypothetical protein
MSSEKNDMDIGGVNRIRPATAQIGTEVKRNNSSATDRDAGGSSGYERQEKPTVLTPDQEDEALKKLNSLPSFVKSGLRAELVREEGRVTHFVVRDAGGNILRQMTYDQIIAFYVERNTGNEKGNLLRRAA